MNTAARLESVAESGQILVSYATYAQICDDIPCVSRGQVEVKGIPHPIDVYEALVDGEIRPRDRLDEDLGDSKLVLGVGELGATERARFAGLLRDLLTRLPDDDASSSEATPTDKDPRVWPRFLQHLIARIWTIDRKFRAFFSNLVANRYMSFILQKQRSTMFPCL